jgi:hypothetical protein
MKHSKNTKIHLHKGWIIGLSVLVALIILSVVLAAIFPYHPDPNSPYCDSIDPTECTIKVVIFNDTNVTYTIKQCKDDIPCKSFAATVTLAPDNDHVVNGSTEDVPQPWTVFNPQGKIVGCLNLSYTKYNQPPVTEPLSKMLSCQDVQEAIIKFDKKYHSW